MKHLKVLSGTVLMTVLVVSAFAFTSKDFHKAVDETCYQFTPATPNSTNVLQFGNYAEAAADCPQTPQKWCAICFDPDAHPEYLTEDGELNFSNTTLNSVVSSNWNVPGQDGTTVSGITLHYRRLAP